MATASSPSPVTTPSTASQTAARIPHQTAEEAGSARHIFTVAARSLQDCVELLQSLKEAVVAEQDGEEHGAKKDQDRNANGARSNGHGNKNEDRDSNSNGNSNSNSKSSSNGQGQALGLGHCAVSGAILSRTSSRTSMQEIHHMSRTGSQDSENAVQPPQQPQQHTTKTKVVAVEKEGLVLNKGTTQAAAAAAATAAGLIVLSTCKKSEIYTKPSTLACKGTIGKHVRHLHDHYRLLFSTYPPAQVRNKAKKEIQRMQDELATTLKISGNQATIGVQRTT